MKVGLEGCFFGYIALHKLPIVSYVLLHDSIKIPIKARLMVTYALVEKATPTIPPRDLKGKFPSLPHRNPKTLLFGFHVFLRLLEERLELKSGVTRISLGPPLHSLVCLSL